VDGDLYVNTGPIRLNGGYIGADTDDYSWTWLRGTGGSDTEEVWDFGVSAPWADTLDGHGGYFTFRGRTVYAGSSGAFPALARWHWWAADVTQETYKGAAGIALLKGTGGNGDGTEEMVLSLVAGGDHTLKLQDNAGATSLSITDSDDTEVVAIDSDGNAQFDGTVQGDGGLRTKVATDNVSDPPTDAELDSAFGTPATVGAGFVGVLDDNDDATDVYICYTDGSAWFYVKGTKAV